MSTDTSTSLRVSRMIKADRETVFRAWTDPEHLKHWAAPEGGYTVARAEVDLVVGGRYRCEMHTPAGETIAAFGTYREIRRPSRLVYTWDWEGESIGETVVTVEFNDVGGATEVVLTHERFANAEAKSNHEKGWMSCLNKLERLFDPTAKGVDLAR